MRVGLSYGQTPTGWKRRRLSVECLEKWSYPSHNMSLTVKNAPGMDIFPHLGQGGGGRPVRESRTPVNMGN
jgi:hypothetical protein